IVRVETVKRSLDFLSPGGWCDYEFRALVREEGRELGELEVVTHLQADAMAFEVDDHRLGPGVEDQRLSVPKVDLPVDRRARRSRREGGVVERPTGTLRESAHDYASRRPGHSLDGSEDGERLDIGLRFFPVLVHVSATGQLREDNDVSGHGLGPPSHAVPVWRRRSEGGRELNEP